MVPVGTWLLHTDFEGGERGRIVGGIVQSDLLISQADFDRIAQSLRAGWFCDNGCRIVHRELGGAHIPARTWVNFNQWLRL